MKRTLLVGLLIAWCIASSAQTYKAELGAEGTTQAIKISDASYAPDKGPLITSLPGWPKRISANASFKNMRGLAVDDIDGDGVNEIVAAANSTLYVFESDGSLLWTKALAGTAIYPPTVGDINLDGHLEIAQATGGSPANGRVYLLDQNGNDLPGWPLNLTNNWILCSPVMADVDGNDSLEIIFNERVSPQGRLHIRKINGSSFSASWPVTINATPSVTPSVGDIDGDGSNEIILCSYNDILAFALDGNLKAGFPVLNTNTTFSYQSPLLVDLEHNGKLNIVGSTIGSVPEYYVMNYDGTYHNGWPVAVPDGNWTYCAPAVADLNHDGVYSIFMTRPINDTILPMLYGFDKNASALPNFPISAQGGDEGIVTVADVDNDGQYEIVTGSNLCIGGYGFVHAFKLDGSGEANGFPLRPAGFTYMNGADLADLNNDNMLELITLSYDQTMSASDSVTINVFALNVPYTANTVLFGTYKGDNTRQGLINSGYLGIHDFSNNESSAQLYPNPSQGLININVPENMRGDYQLNIFNTLGMLVYQGLFYDLNSKSPAQIQLDLKPGLYHFQLSGNQHILNNDIIIADDVR